MVKGKCSHCTISLPSTMKGNRCEQCLSIPRGKQVFRARPGRKIENDPALRIDNSKVPTVFYEPSQKQSGYPVSVVAEKLGVKKERVFQLISRGELKKIRGLYGISVDPKSLFDLMEKRNLKKLASAVDYLVLVTDMSTKKHCFWCLAPTEKRNYCSDSHMRKFSQWNWINGAMVKDRAAVKKTEPVASIVKAKATRDTLEGQNLAK